MRVAGVALALAGAGLLPDGLTAQGSSGQIKFTVYGDLDFGQVIAGILYQMDPGESGAAAVQTQSEKDTEMFLRFILPPELMGPGGSSLPLSFDGSSGRLNLDNNDPSGGSYFDPGIPINYTPTEQNGKAYFWLGATLEVPYSARGGLYEGVIIVEAGYTGT